MFLDLYYLFTYLSVSTMIIMFSLPIARGTRVKIVENEKSIVWFPWQPICIVNECQFSVTNVIK